MISKRVNGGLSVTLHKETKRVAYTPKQLLSMSLSHQLRYTFSILLLFLPSERYVEEIFPLYFYHLCIVCSMTTFLLLSPSYFFLPFDGSTLKPIIEALLSTNFLQELRRHQLFYIVLY